MPDSRSCTASWNYRGRTLQALVDELITGATRLGLEERLAAALPSGGGARRHGAGAACDQQVLGRRRCSTSSSTTWAARSCRFDPAPELEAQDRSARRSRPPGRSPRTALPVLGANPFNYSALFS